MQTSPTHRTCLVLGGRGFVGSAVVAEAMARGYTTTVVGRKEYDTLIGTSCDLLINANGNSRKYIATRDPSLDFEYSVQSVQRSLRDFPCKQYVYLSSIDVYSDVSDPTANTESTVVDPTQLSHYGFHKHLAEELVRHEAPDWLILRMGGFVGPNLWKNSIFDLLTGIPLRVHPNSAYQYLHTTTLADILFHLVEAGHKNDLFNVVGRDVISLHDVAEMIPDAHVEHDSDAPVERYEISVDRLAAHYPVPETRATVWRFLSDVMQGRVRIGKAVS